MSADDPVDQATFDEPATIEDPAGREESSGEAGPDRCVVVRHGSTDWSRARRHTGRTDRPLSDDGAIEARKLGHRLASFRPDLVLSSPLARARSTCRLAGFADGAVIDDDLVEWDYGDYEGLTYEQIRTQDPKWNLFRDGCPGGESPGQIGARVDRFLDRLRASRESALSEVMIFAHGHVLRVLTARWLELDVAAGQLFELDAAGVGVLERKRAAPVLERWNC